MAAGLVGVNEMPTAPDIAGPVPDPKKPDHRLPPLSCDSHAHVFGPVEDYPYSSPRDYTPHDAPRKKYAELLHGLGFQRAVLVQPSVYGTDNRLLADALAASKKDSLGIEWRGVAVLHDSVSDGELEQLDELGVRGARLNLINKGAALNFDNVSRLAQRLAPLGWHLQFLIDISQFEHFRQRIGDLPVASVIDHMGHFPASKGPQCPAFQDLLALMREGRTWVKLSGPNRFSAYDAAPFPDSQVLARSLIENSPERLVFGTDWPHVKLSTSMPDDGDLVDEFYRWIDNDAELAQRILVDNPAKLYSF